MIGKVQDLVSAAVVFSAADSASRGATEKQQQTAPEVSSQPATPPTTTDAPVQAGGDSRKLGAEDQNADVRRAQKQAEDQQQKMDEKSVDLMTKELNELMDKIDCNLAFKYNKDVDVMTVKMIDKETKEVLKEFPPEEMVKSMVKTKEWIGAFLDEHA